MRKDISVLLQIVDELLMEIEKCYENEGFHPEDSCVWWKAWTTEFVRLKSKYA